MNDKIRPEHRQRAAYVYVRQSTQYQVRHHREGQQRQYELEPRARQLGFGQVVVIDEDLGRSGSGRQERPGFGRLLAAVCQGLAGAVLALEASRLARNNRDWHHLVDLCALTDTLLIDDDGIYDPKVLNDRLLLGLKGTMSEFELGLMRQRARQAYLQKVKRGEALWQLPVGFVRAQEGRIEMTPDRQVQQAIEMVFAKFRQLGSARQTLLWLRDERLMLPHAVAGSAGQEVIWRAASLSRVQQVLRNPCYAGAFAFGRTATRMIVQEDRLRRGASRRYRPQAEWEVLILDNHPGYIRWAEYLENRAIMARNVARRESESAGAVKRGPALLSGLLRCGRCGRKLQVGYSGSDGKVGRYLCLGRREERGSGSCFSMGRLKVDQSVVEQVLAAIAPGGIEAALQASEASVAADQEKRRALELALERARYEAQRARRQYDLADPENRLVAGELETRWNGALQSVAELEQRVQTLTQAPSSITAEQKQQLRELGQELPRVWNDPETSVELKKQILRTVIEEILVQSAPGSPEHRLQIHWVGGVHTELVVPRNRSGRNSRQADEKVAELVGELVKVCEDRMIAITLNRLGYRTGQGNPWNQSRVGAFRHTHGLPKFEKRVDWVTLEEAARVLSVSSKIVHTLLRKGILAGRQVVAFAPWVIERKNLELPSVRAAVAAAKRGRRVPSTVVGQPELTL
jgi:DNA invertase Pin-like site-specific DNA recombinase